MKLTHVRIKDFRSFSGEHEFAMSTGVNYFVGPNNCGKSNLLRAVELALDPDSTYLPERDRPARQVSLGAPPKTRITLTFEVGNTGPEKTLLSRARDYELRLRETRANSTSTIQTYADDSQIRMVAAFGTGGTRQTTFQAKGLGAGYLPAESPENVKLEAQFRKVVRFAVVHSGEDLQSLLAGKFREILQMVIADHLSEELTKAQEARSMYLAALQKELLEPLRSQIHARVTGMFPEITVADLVPDVPTVAQTISSVDVQLGDAMTTQLSEKGTGVRGTVLVSMLQYLAEQSRRSLVLAVEEPEAFLHPGAQESIRGELEKLASRADVTLVVTTHSPYVISRYEQAQITELQKSPDGTTGKAGAALGNELRSKLLGALYRDVESAEIVERSLAVPENTRAVVVTEGYTDGLFLELVCKAVERADVVDGLHFIPAGSAAKVVLQALTTRSATGVPVLALLDHDDQGRAARDKLKAFDWNPKSELVSLSSWPGGCKKHDIEIEDLLPQKAVAKLVMQLGEDAALDGKEKCGAHWHLRPTKEWKDAAISRLESYLTKGDPGGMVWLAEELQSRAEKVAAAKEKRRAFQAAEETGK
ncbi:AAA family ATPase [Georgenia sp. M64]|uniref:ATP-dependent nuclease n=1 Tax=Georgenia sp. M64 TaxID=3120520 RepID=UPI0030E0D86E